MKKCDDIKKSELAYAIKFNVGAHNNYVFFWEGLAPIEEGGYMGPRNHPDLHDLITKSFGDVEKFKREFSATIDVAEKNMWVWLAYNTRTGELEIRTTRNHG